MEVSLPEDVTARLVSPGSGGAASGCWGLPSLPSCLPTLGTPCGW